MGIILAPFLFAINITLYPFWAIRAIQSNLIIPPATLVKFEDILRLYRGIEQLLVAFWGHNT